MFNGLFSLISLSWGNGSLSVSSPEGTFPPAGSYNSTLFGETYPTAEGGTSFTDPTNGAGPQIPNQICDVDVLNDGSGGTYIDWSSATNVQYKAYGVVFITQSSLPLDIEVPSGSGFYYQGGTQDIEYFHDGTGWWSSGLANQSYYSNGTDTNIESLNGGNQQTEVPTGSVNYYDNGLFNGYTWDGSGGYNYPVTKGNYFAADTDDNISALNTTASTEVPSGSGIYYANGIVEGYTWDGSGGYNYPVIKGSFYANGTDTNLEVLDVANQSTYSVALWADNGTYTGYLWDGSGGYTTSSSKGSYYPAGTDFNLQKIPTGMQTQTPVEVPSGSGNYYDSEEEVELYEWDGSGNIVFNTYGFAYYPSGTFIYNDGLYNYYWNGNGGYYN